jgi:hypothetical protein
MHTCAIGYRKSGKWAANIWAGPRFALRMTENITPLLGRTHFRGAMGLSTLVSKRCLPPMLTAPHRLEQGQMQYRPSRYVTAHAGRSPHAQRQ